MNIIWKKPDGSVAVTHCKPGVDPQNHAVELMARGDVPADWVAVEHNADIPTARDFRDAWQFNGVLGVDLEKAREVTKNRLRAERTALLAAQDVAMLRAMEDGSDTTAIKVEKQRLRDVTKLADACATLDELRGLKCA